MDEFLELPVLSRASDQRGIVNGIRDWSQVADDELGGVSSSSTVLSVERLGIAGRGAKKPIEPRWLMLETDPAFESGAGVAGLLELSS